MKLVPYKRIGEPEDIARTAVWLASDYADYISGTTLYVDGGMTLFPGFTEVGQNFMTATGYTDRIPSFKKNALL